MINGILECKYKEADVYSGIHWHRCNQWIFWKSVMQSTKTAPLVAMLDSGGSQGNWLAGCYDAFTLVKASLFLGSEEIAGSFPVAIIFQPTCHSAKLIWNMKSDLFEHMAESWESHASKTKAWYFLMAEPRLVHGSLPLVRISLTSRAPYHKRTDNPGMWLPKVFVFGGSIPNFRYSDHNTVPKATKMSWTFITLTAWRLSSFRGKMKPSSSLLLIPWCGVHSSFAATAPTSLSSNAQKQT